MDLRDITIRIEGYVNERIIEELEGLINPTEEGFGKAVIIRRIKELKQE